MSLSTCEEFPRWRIAEVEAQAIEVNRHYLSRRSVIVMTIAMSVTYVHSFANSSP